MQIAVLGPLEVRANDGTVTEVSGARLRGLLIALALRPGQLISRASLIDWIWGGRPPDDAANALQRLVSRLRRALPDTVEGRVDGYRLTVAPDAVDAVQFERLVTAGRADTADGHRRVRLLGEALDLWRGPAMQDVGLQGSAAFDAAVDRLEGLRLTALEERLGGEIDLGRGAEVVAELTDLVAAHPLRERLVAALMRALVAAGRSSEALLVFQRAREALADALGVDPSPELSALHVALLRRERDHPLEAPRTNLREEISSFIGKDADVQVVRELVTEHRLTTLVGPGGVGKTRLATETARTLVDDLPDGAWLVELTSVGTDAGPGVDTEGDMAQATLAAFGLRDALLGDAPNAEPTNRLIAAIRDREALLILDNCEHVIDATATFAHRVLGACSRLRVLATSREPLGITGEALWLVEPLALPEDGADPTMIASSPAVALLRDRARAVRRELPVDYGALVTMARICRALDGLPLAIELAAARVRTLSLNQLADGLHDRFRLLTSGSRTALPHHKTLRAVVDWSWELLTDAEQTVLSRLSVFSDGASVEAAERVCAGDMVEPKQVPELLTALAEKSLLRTDGEGAPRYRLITTIREYAAQRLAEAGGTDAARHAHLAWFTELTEVADPHLRRAEQLEWLAALSVEHNNIGAAMRGALAAGEAHSAMRLAAGAGWYWWIGGHKDEGSELLTAATATPGEVSDEIRAMVYALAVLFASSGRGDEHQAAEWIHEAFRYSRRSRSRYPLTALVDPLERMLNEPDALARAWEPLLDDADPWVRALARLQFGKMQIMLGEGGRDADAQLETALAEFRMLGERFGISFALTELADRVAVRGDFAGACALFEQAIAVVTEVGSVEDVIRMRARQAQLYQLQGDAESSATALAEAQRCAEQVTWSDALAELALCRAELARWAGNVTEARTHLEAATALLGGDADRPSIRSVTHDLLGYLAVDLDESRAYRRAAVWAASEAGHAPQVAQVLVGVADLALRREQYEQAARLLAASAGVRGLQDQSHPEISRIERTARDRLGEERFAAATREGAQTSWPDLAAATLDA